MEEDLRRAGLLEDADSAVKDSDPDQKLTLKQLLKRYKGEPLLKSSRFARKICKPTCYASIL